MPLRRTGPVIVAALSVTACDGSPAGADQPGCGAEPIELAAGVAVSLSPGRGECEFAAAPGAEYALVYLDTRIVSAGASAVEPFWVDESYSVHITETSGAARSAGISAGLRWSTAPPDFVSTLAGPPSFATFFDRAVPWAVGDTVMTPGCPPEAPTCSGERSRAATVVRVHDGWMAIAMVQGAPDAARALALLDQAYPLVREYGLPLMGSVFGAARPTTSAANGQLLVVVGAGGEPRPSRAWSSAGADGTVHGWIELWLGDTDVARVTSLLAHELAHIYQHAWSHASRSPGIAQSRTGTTRWGVEGGANLISYEVIRRIAGAPLAGNYDWRNPGADPFRAYYALRAQSSSGDFTGGYDGTMPFLRDLVIRRVQKGEAVDAALREVSRGALEGWSGIDALGSRRAGLVGRMRSLLGAGWEPEDALLTCTLSVVGDDRNPGAVYQDPASLRVWDVRPGEYGWHPDGIVGGGSGAAVTATRPYGSPGYSYLVDGGSGVRVRLASSVPEQGMRWMVMRVK